jgi:phage repressor protein C with HTH and peptisase S24 domain
MSRKKELSADQKAECARAKALFEARKSSLKLTQAKLAEEANISPPAVAMYLNGQNPLNAKFAAVLARTLGVQVSEFSKRLESEINAYAVPLSDVLKKTDLSGLDAPGPEASMLGPISAWDDDTELDDDEVAIPLLKDVRVAAGTGRIAEDYDSGKKIRMGKYTLRNQGVQFDKAVCVTVHGNSMEPALPEGSTVGVNLGNTAVKDGKVYVIKHEGELRVKQLYRLPGGGLRFRSFNRAEHDDEDYSPQEMLDKHIEVVGKVFWSSVLWD